MSYARLGPDSDVYVVDGGKGLFCEWCQLEGDGKPFDHRGMVIHLREHRLAGHKVPAEAFDRLADEIAHGCDNILTRTHTAEEIRAFVDTFAGIPRAVVTRGTPYAPETRTPAPNAGTVPVGSLYARQHRDESAIVEALADFGKEVVPGVTLSDIDAVIDRDKALEAKHRAKSQQHHDNTPSCSVCGYAPQVRGCTAGKCGRVEP